MKKGFLAALVAIILIGCIASVNTGCSFDNEEEYYANVACDTLTVKYSSSVAPIFNQTCAPCHSQNGGTLPFLDNYADVKDYLDMADSNLIKRINFVGPNAGMPQGGTKMGVCDIRKIEIWIAAGYPNN